jgi:hypothetical protein
MAKKRSQNPLSRNQSSRPPQQAMPPDRLLADLRGLIEHARVQVGRQVEVERGFADLRTAVGR